MKFVKIALTFGAALALFSCEKTPVFTGEATVGFASDTTEIGFANAYEQIPVVLEGHSNVWPLQIHVEVVAEYDGEGYPAVEDKDFLLTAHYLNIGKPADYDELIADSGSVVVEDGLEVTFPNRAEATEYRFKLRITSATKGVTIGTAETVVIASMDDLQRLAGTYTINGDLYTNEGSSFESEGANNDESKLTASGNTLNFTGFFGETGKLKMERSEDGNGVNLMLGFKNSFVKTEKEPNPENPDETVSVKYYYGLCVVDSNLEIQEDVTYVAGKYFSGYDRILFEEDSNLDGKYIALAKYNAEGEFVSFFENKFLQGIRFDRK